MKLDMKMNKAHMDPMMRDWPQASKDATMFMMNKYGNKSWP